MYLVAYAYRLKVSVPTNKKPMNNANTMKYLMQKRPSLIAIAILFLQSINISITINNIRKLKEIR
jgi:hypothetical protein